MAQNLIITSREFIKFADDILLYNEYEKQLFGEITGSDRI